MNEKGMVIRYFRTISRLGQKTVSFFDSEVSGGWRVGVRVKLRISVVKEAESG